MEFFNTIGQVLTTPNEGVANIVCAPLIIIEAIVTMLLFTTIFHITTTKKRKIIYVFISGSLCLLSRFAIPNPYRYIY